MHTFQILICLKFRKPMYHFCTSSQSCATLCCFITENLNKHLSDKMCKSSRGINALRHVQRFSSRRATSTTYFIKNTLCLMQRYAKCLANSSLRITKELFSKINKKKFTILSIKLFFGIFHIKQHEMGTNHIFTSGC